MQHWGAQQTTLHREAEERDRVRELSRTPHNEKTVIYGLHAESISQKVNKFSFGFGSVTMMVFFFIWTASESELDNFLEWLNNFYPNLSLHMSVPGRKSVSLILLLDLIKLNLSPISTANLQMAISTFTLSHESIVTQNL